MRKRFVSLLLAFAMALCLMPTAAMAADNGKAIQLGTSGISGYNSETNKYNYIYMGNFNSAPIKWRVLDTKTNTGSDGVFLLSEALLGSGKYGGVYFDKKRSPLSNEWQGSMAQAWCTDFVKGTAFFALERGAILKTTKIDKATSDGNFEASQLIDEKVFFLSAEEAYSPTYGFNGKNTFDGNRVATYGSSNGTWWLRSPHTSNSTPPDAGVVGNRGHASNGVVSNDRPPRPAFNLDSGSVLFTSAADENSGKGTGVFALAAVSDYAGSEWKLTLEDSSRSGFAAETTAVTGTSLSISYSGAQTGVDEWISAIIKDAGGNITYYGRLKNVATEVQEKGVINIDIGGKINEGDTLYVFNERCNGTNKTDYASPLREIGFTKVEVSTSLSERGTVAGGGFFPKGKDVTVTAAAKPGYYFVRWQLASGDGTVIRSYDASYIFTLTGNIDLMAVFDPYVVEQGYDQTVTQGDEAVFISDAPFAEFSNRVQIGTTVLDPSKYTCEAAESGKTKLTLKGDCTAELEAKGHTLSMHYANASGAAYQVDAKFTVQAAVTPPQPTPMITPKPTPTPAPTPTPTPTPTTVPTGGGTRDERDRSSDYTAPAQNSAQNESADIRLSGIKIPNGEKLVTVPAQSKALMKMLGKNKLVGIWDISLKGGKTSIEGSTLRFSVGRENAGKMFTLYHEKADGTVESFSATADAQGIVSFYPINELSPFMLVEGGGIVTTSIVSVPATGDRNVGLALLLLSAMMAAAVLIKRRKAQA